MELAIGDQIPPFELPDTDRRSWSSADGAGATDGAGGTDGDGGTATATAIVFTCNHCPYALAWHDRILEAARDYAERGVRFVQINSNDAERYPRDSYEAMQQRVAAEDWPMPYLHDSSQEVARAFGAKVTPDVFVFDADGRLRYRGAPDSDYEDPGQRAAWLRSALEAVLSGEDPAEAETKPVGCSIKWKP